MQVFFADDSTQKGARAGMGSVIGLGGIFVAHNCLRPLAAAVDAIATEVGIPKVEEVKWSPKKGTWIHENLHGDARRDCYARMLQAAAGHNVRAIVTCWDTGHTWLKGEDAFTRCVKYLFERITMHLEAVDDHAILIADRPGGGKKQEEEFLSDFIAHVEAGTEYVVPDRVLLNVLTTPSHLLRHLQIADLVTGIVTSMVCGSYDYAQPLFPHIKTLLAKNNNECAGGTGLKIFPRDLVNLYYWVLNENLYHTGGGAMAYRLPQPHLPYAKNEHK